MKQRYGVEATNKISHICQISIIMSIFFATHSIDFLYSSKIYLFNIDIIFLDLFALASYIIILVILLNPSIIKDLKLRFIIVSIISFIFFIVIMYYGVNYAIDPMNYFVTLEDTWYKKQNLDRIKEFQRIFQCCNFQPTIIDSANECHHGFKTPCIKYLLKHQSNSIIITGMCRILQAIAHALVFSTSFGFAISIKESNPFS